METRAASTRETSAGRTWTGVCAHAEQVEVEPDGLSTYHLHVVPHLWRTTRRKNSRIFQHLSLVDIAVKLLEEWKIEVLVELDRSRFPRFEYRVQYAETDFVFLTRILEEAGISYTFRDPEGEGGRDQDGPRRRAAHLRRAGRRAPPLRQPQGRHAEGRPLLPRAARAPGARRPRDRARLRLPGPARSGALLPGEAHRDARREARGLRVPARQRLHRGLGGRVGARRRARGQGVRRAQARGRATRPSRRRAEDELPRPPRGRGHVAPRAPAPRPRGQEAPDHAPGHRGHVRRARTPRPTPRCSPTSPTSRRWSPPSRRSWACRARSSSARGARRSTPTSSAACACSSTGTARASATSTARAASA